MPDKSEVPDMAEMDKMMQELFSSNFGGNPSGDAPPDISNLAKLLGQFGNEESGEGENVSDDKVKEAQKLF
jgi:hypothetical protein